MSVQLKFNCYAKSPTEVANLRNMAGIWRKEPGGFWSFDQVIDALQRPTVRLFYLTPDVDVANRVDWLAIALIDIGPYSADLLYVFTAPEMRGQGVARSILRKLLVWLRGEMVDGCQGIRREDFFLEVRLSNSPAIKLYESLGMSRVQIRKKYYSDGEDALVMKLRIRNND